MNILTSRSIVNRNASSHFTTRRNKVVSIRAESKTGIATFRAALLFLGLDREHLLPRAKIPNLDDGGDTVSCRSEDRTEPLAVWTRAQPTDLHFSTRDVEEIRSRLGIPNPDFAGRSLMESSGNQSIPDGDSSTIRTESGTDGGAGEIYSWTSVGHSTPDHHRSWLLGP